MSKIKEEIEKYRGLYPNMPIDDVTAVNCIVSRIKSNTPTTHERKLKRSFVRKDNGVTYEDTLDTYYASMINDVLSEIKKKHEAYVFSFEHIKEIVAFIPTVCFTYLKDADCFVTSY